MRTPAQLSLEELYAAAADATARGSKSFHLATRFFPPELARSTYAIYWFCRYTDDIVDKAPSAEDGRRHLDAWEEELRHALHGSDAEHPILRVFIDAVRRHDLDPEYPLALISGVRMDLGEGSYETFEDLHVFCYRVASVVGLMMAQVIGWEQPGAAPDGRTYATDLGVAMQLTNIIRDVGEDLELGRVYLPSAEMDQFGYTIADLRSHTRNQAFHDLMHYQVDRARRFYKRAEPGIALLHERGRFAVQIAADVYRQILAVVESADYDVFSRRAVVSKPAKYWLSARSLARPVLRSWLLPLRSAG